MRTLSCQNQKQLDGYVVYDLSTDPGNKWSVAILDLYSSPAHSHRLGIEDFTVLDGELDITIDGVQHILGVGEKINIPIGAKHALKSTSPHKAVRLLCINFPAFNPNDMLEG